MLFYVVHRRWHSSTHRIIILPNSTCYTVVRCWAYIFVPKLLWPDTIQMRNGRKYAGNNRWHAFYLLWPSICMVTRYRAASMPCTRLKKVGIWRWSSSCLQSLGQASMRRTAVSTPCCTGQPRGATVRWHATWLKNWRWIHRTGTRCVGSQGKERCVPKYKVCVHHVCVCIC